MTVEELISKLSSFDGKDEVCICYDSSYGVAVILDVYKDKYGRVLLDEDIRRSWELGDD